MWFGFKIGYFPHGMYSPFLDRHKHEKKSYGYGSKLSTPNSWMVFLLNMIRHLWVIGTIILSQTHIVVFKTVKISDDTPMDP